MEIVLPDSLLRQKKESRLGKMLKATMSAKIGAAVPWGLYHSFI